MAKKAGSGIPPTLEEVTNYCLDRKNGINPEEWWCYYDAKGWMIGKNKMVNWQSAIRTWEIRNKKYGTYQQQSVNTGCNYQNQRQQQRMREYAEVIAATANQSNRAEGEIWGY